MRSHMALRSASASHDDASRVVARIPVPPEQVALAVCNGCGIRPPWPIRCHVSSARSREWRSSTIPVSTSSLKTSWISPVGACLPTHDNRRDQYAVLPPDRGAQLGIARLVTLHELDEHHVHVVEHQSRRAPDRRYRGAPGRAPAAGRSGRRSGRSARGRARYRSGRTGCRAAASRSPSPAATSPC